MTELPTPIRILAVLQFLFLFTVISCKSSEQIIEDEPPYQPFYAIDDSLEKDREIEAWLHPYRTEYEQEMGRVIATAEGDFTFGQPESSLGNLVSDLIRYRASHEMRQYVHVGLIDDESFQLELLEGDITLGELYEFMPYSSSLVVFEMNGNQIQNLANEIAEKGGVPVSGLRMNIRDNSAGSVLVHTESPIRIALILLLPAVILPLETEAIQRLKIAMYDTIMIFL